MSSMSQFMLLMHIFALLYIVADLYVIIVGLMVNVFLAQELVMTSRAGPRAAGTDGSDFKHREKVVPRYQMR